ncbi:MAG: hypothetical protein ACR2MG_16065 [Pyrinomonadaceae bacterium]
MPDPNELAKSEEMINFYRTLAAIQTNAIFRIMSASTDIEMKRFAREETELLRSVWQGKGGNKCQPGQVWNEVTGRCE